MEREQHYPKCPMHEDYLEPRNRLTECICDDIDTDSFSQLLAKAIRLVQAQTVACSCDCHTGTSGHGGPCIPACIGGRIPDPRWAAVKDVLTEKLGFGSLCPCVNVEDPVAMQRADPECKGCYGEGIGDGSGIIPRRVWQELREQGIKGALDGAITWEMSMDAFKAPYRGDETQTIGQQWWALRDDAQRRGFDIDAASIEALIQALETQR